MKIALYLQIFDFNLIRKLNNNKRYVIFNAIFAAFISFIALGFYHYYFKQSDILLKEYRNHAIKVAENEVFFSDRFNKAFRSSQPNDFIAAAESSRKAVVFIKSNSIQKRQKEKAISNTGSGVILSNDGYIITNQHVVASASKIEVTLNDNRVFIATLIGEDLSTDLALLKIESQNLDFMVFGNSDSLRIGEWVMAVGNPFRLQSTVTAGIVSAKARNINLLQNQGIESFIQTDAAVNPGNSGGALINTGGELIGICTAILSESGRYEGFSFAIPGNLARKVVADLKEYGAVQRGWLGVDIENIDNTIAEDLGLDEVSGVLISYVSKDGGAEEAGLSNNDVIVTVNNIKTANTSEFMELLGQYKPGDQLNVVYIRNRKKNIAKPILRNQLNTTDLIGIRDDAVFKQLGIEVRELDTYEKAVYSPDGIMVVSIKNGSIIGNTKMEPAYIITSVNNKKVLTANALKKYLETNHGKTIIFDGFYPKFSGLYPYTFEMP